MDLHPGAGAAWPISAWVVLGGLLLAAGAALALWWRARGQLRQARRRLYEASTQFSAGATDARTGLMSRDDFEARLDEEALRCDRGAGPLALLFVDIDGFAAINEAHGHGAGDALLEQAAERIHQASPGKAAAARQGGDEFLVLLPHLRDRAEAARLAQRLNDALARPFTLGHNEVAISASIERMSASSVPVSSLTSRSPALTSWPDSKCTSVTTPPTCGVTSMPWKAVSVPMPAIWGCQSSVRAASAETVSGGRGAPMITSASIFGLKSKA